MKFNVKYRDGGSSSKVKSVTANKIRNRKGFLQFRKNRKTVFMIQASFVTLVEPAE